MDFPETEPGTLVTSDSGLIDLHYWYFVVLAYRWHRASSSKWREADHASRLLERSPQRGLNITGTHHHEIAKLRMSALCS